MGRTRTRHNIPQISADDIDIIGRTEKTIREAFGNLGRTA
jgi:hypothetical protein